MPVFSLLGARKMLAGVAILAALVGCATAPEAPGVSGDQSPEVPANLVEVAPGSVRSSPEDIRIAYTASTSVNGPVVPAGWGQMSESAVRTFVADKTFRIIYLASPEGGEIFRYDFRGERVTRQRLSGGTGATRPQTGRYSVGADGVLCARWNVRLCYTFLTDGTRTMARRSFNGRYFYQMYGPQ